VEARARATRARDLTNSLFSCTVLYVNNTFTWVPSVTLLGVVCVDAPFLLGAQRDARREPRFVFHLLLLASAQHFLRNHSRPGNGWLEIDWTQSRESQAVKAI
jgi:hypothetical protein